MEANKIWVYISEEWLPITKMWIMGHINLPYRGQNTNVVILRYQSNFKAIMKEWKGRGYERCATWTIYQLVKDYTFPLLVPIPSEGTRVYVQQ